MKPDWKDAPEWARWLAQDADGEWCWYEHEPYKEASYWAPLQGRLERAFSHSDSWQDSLEALEDQQCPDQPA